ncbi:MAG: hypothetical protein ACTSV5_14745 [Promethearchaeota archaeon]
MINIKSKRKGILLSTLTILVLIGFLPSALGYTGTVFPHVLDTEEGLLQRGT